MRAELQSVCEQTGKVIIGKGDVIGKILMALLADGHVLLDDVPGVGKTTMAVAVCRALGLKNRRIQFTPDVLPFVDRPGALSGANLVLGDELNRASSKTQSALLEAMEERQVTVDGTTYPLETPFMVIATQNSVGAAGTQPLPYAQMDRFAMRLSIGYPDHASQVAMLRDRQTDNPMDRVETVLSRERVIAMQREARLVTVKDSILEYISSLSVASRNHEAVEVGISPRGALYLDRVSKAHAYLDGRDYVTGADVQAVLRDVCAHRIVMRAVAAATPADVLDDLRKKVPNPDRGRRL